MIDLLVYIIVRGFVGVLNLLPLKLRLAVITFFVRTVTAILPGFSKISLRNLEIAFPESDPIWRKQILNQSYGSLARVIVDFARLQHLDADWVYKNVECEFLPRFKKIKAENPGKGVLIATGHLGSFELLAHCVAMYGYPISFVVRPFKLPRFNAWWTGIREKAGNRAIMRKGAFKDIVRDLGTGRDVAILFDQNVTRNHAVFVDWFGHPAATTKTVALAAIRTEAPVIVASIGHLNGDKYIINACECDFRALYADTTLNNDEKVFQITAALSARYEEMIRTHAGEWFWMHKRWKTRPEETSPSFYKTGGPHSAKNPAKAPI